MASLSGSLTGRLAGSLAGGFGGLWVDSVNGDDGASGRSPGEAWQTLAALSSLSNPSQIYLVRGSHWREELTDLPTGSAILAYGTGARPIIDGGDVIPNASWSKTVGRTNVYEYAHTASFGAGGGKNAHRVFEDGVRLRRVVDLATCDATVGSFFAPTPTGGADTIYVHASDSSDVTANGKVYDLTARQWAVQLYDFLDQARVVGVEGRNNAHADGSLAVDGYLGNAIARNGRIHNVFIRGMAEDVDAVGIEPGTTIGGATMFVTHMDESLHASMDGRNTILRRCRALADLGALSENGNQNTGVTLGFFGHVTRTDPSFAFGTMQREDCYAENCLTAYGMSQAARSVLYRCGCSNVNLGVADNSTDLVVVLGGEYDLDVIDNKVFAYNNDFEVPAQLIARGVKVYRRFGGVGPVWVNVGNVVECDAEISRCTFVSLPAGGGQANWLQDGAFNWHHNICTGANLTGVRRGSSGETPLPGFTADYNCYYNPTGVASWQEYDGVTLNSYLTIADWRTQTGQEANSVVEDPDIADPAAGDFTIGNASLVAAGIGAEVDEEDDAELQTLWETYRVG